MGRFFSFGRRQGKPASCASPPPPGDTPEEWHANDIAECIYGGAWFNGVENHARGPENGQVLRVADVIVAPIGSVIPGAIALVFERFPKNGYAASAFRKITPRADAAEAADADFIAAIDRLRQPETV